MQGDGGSEVVPPDVERALCSDADVEFAVAFGSRVTGTHRQSSDLDVAVKFSDDLSATERFRKRCRLSARVQQPDAPFVDVSDLEDLSLGFAHDAVNGELVCGDESAFRSFAKAIEAEFEAQHEAIERRQRAVIERIAEDGLHG